MISGIRAIRAPYRIVTATLLGLVALLGAKVGPAGAHPFDATYYSCRAVVAMNGDGLKVTVVVEVPTVMILDEFLSLYGDPTQLDDEADAIFRRRQFDKLAADLVLHVDRQVPAGRWQPVQTEANGRGTETFFVYLLEFVPDEPERFAAAERLDVRVEMNVFSRDFIYLSASTEVEAPWRVVLNSAEPLLAATDDELFDPETGRWTVDPRLRRLRVKLEKTPAPSPSPADSPTSESRPY